MVDSLTDAAHATYKDAEPSRSRVVMVVQEVFSPKPLGASGVVLGLGGGQLGGFLCTAAGTMALSYGVDGSGAVFVAAFAVTAGTFYPLPFAFGNGTAVYCTFTGGAAGTFCVA